MSGIHRRGVLLDGIGSELVRASTGGVRKTLSRWLGDLSNAVNLGDIASIFTAGDATPSVLNNSKFITAGATAITNLDDGIEGQTITIYRGDSDIVITDNANIETILNTNLTLSLAKPSASFRLAGGAWIEVTPERVSAALTAAVQEPTLGGFAREASVPHRMENVAALRLQNLAEADAPNIVVVDYCHVAGADPGARYRLIEGDTSSEDNGGTIIETAGGPRYKLDSDHVWLEQFGADSDGVVSFHTQLNTYLTETAAGRAPRELKIGFKSGAAFLCSTKPDKIDGIAGLKVKITAGTTVYMGFSGADESEALFHFYGNSPWSDVDFVGAVIATANNGSAGGSLIRYEATPTHAPSEFTVRVGTCSSFGTAPSKSLSAITTAAEAVFTSAGHGYSNGWDAVLDTIAGGTMPVLNGEWCEISDVTTDTFKLKHKLTRSFTMNGVAYSFTAGAYVDTSALGSYSSGGTVKRALVYDAAISVDGMDKDTGATGVRVGKIYNGTIFGGRKGSLLLDGYLAISVHGGALSNAGWNARPWLSGSASVPGTSAKFVGVTLSAVWQDRTVRTERCFVDSPTENRTTANTLTPNPPLSIGVDVPGLATANTFTGAQTWNGLQNTFTYSEDGAGAGPLVQLTRVSTSPAASDTLAQLNWNGRDSGGATQIYAYQQGVIVDPTAASEDGRWGVGTVIAGTLALRLNVGAGAWMTGATGTDQGVGTFNAVGVYDDGVLLSDYVFDHFLGGESYEYSPAVRSKADAFDLAWFDPAQYADYWRAHRRLPGMPDLNDCIDGIVKAQSLGAMSQLLWQTAEVQAIHIDTLRRTVEALTARLEKLEQAAA